MAADPVASSQSEPGRFDGENVSGISIYHQLAQIEHLKCVTI